MMDCIEMLINHNLTVRGSVLEVLDKLSPGVFLKELGEGIGSFRDILVHLIDTERYWMSILKDESVVHLIPADFETVNAVRTAWCSTEELTRGFLKSLDEEQLNHVKSTTRDGSTFYFTIAKAFIHLATHEIHHQGLIVGLLRQLGFDVPEIKVL
jgi:uncharacterized damage-inducible protein DinB